MKTKINRWYNYLIASLLSFLGYGCEHEIYEPCAYGTIATYKAEFKGTITDEKDNPINGIQVVKQFVDIDGIGWNRDSVLTNEKGEYLMNDIYVSKEGYKRMRLVIQDIDGEKNGGVFESDTINMYDIDIKVIKTQEESECDTYAGITNIKLKKKK